MANRKYKNKVVSKKHIARQERERRQSALIRNISIAIIVIIALLIGYGYLDQTVLQQRQSVATVNGEKITVTQFQARVRLERENLINQYVQYAQLAQSFGMDVTAQVQPIEAQLAQPLQVGQNVIDTMIYELLYRQEAKKEGITISTDEVEQEIQAFLDYYPNGTPTPAPSATPVVIEVSTLSPKQLALVTVTPTPTEAPIVTPEATVAPTEAAQSTEATAIPVPTFTATPYTLEGYQQAYQDTLPIYSEYGLDEKNFRFLFESRLYYVKLYDKVTADVSTEGEYVWARHILVDNPALAAIARERLLAGEDFATVAQEASIDPSVATNNGDLGWFTRGMMVAPFEEGAFALENIGDISEPIQSDFGYHIIQLLGRENRPLDANAYQSAKDATFQEWIVAAREASDVQIFDLWQGFTPNEPDLQQTLAQLYGQQ